jgi:hypothetical protein
MNWHRTLIWSAFSIATAAFVTSASAQYPTPEVPKSEPEYIAKAKTAAPESIVNEATIIMMQGKADAKTLQTGSNGFTCLVDPEGTPLCADANGMEWMKAIGAKATPPDKTGFIYMMAGDTGDQQPRSLCDRQEPLGSDWAACHDRRHRGAGDGQHLSEDHGPRPVAGLRHVSGYALRAPDASGGYEIAREMGPPCLLTGDTAAPVPRLAR